MRDQLPLLGTGWGTGRPPRSPRWGGAGPAAVQQRSGGTRPGFDAALGFWNSLPSIAPLTTVPFLFGALPRPVRRHRGHRRRQRHRRTGSPLYQLDDRPTADRRGAAAQPRRAAGGPYRPAQPRPVRRAAGGGPAPRTGAVAARHRRPVRAVLDGAGVRPPRRAARPVAAVRLPGDPRASATATSPRPSWHAASTTWCAGYARGHRPAGDRVLNRAAVARPDFGCRFTTADRPSFGAPCTTLIVVSCYPAVGSRRPRGTGGGPVL